MTRERFQQIAAVFDAAIELAEAERAFTLDRLCGDDAALRREVESLLAASPYAATRIRSAIDGEARLVDEEVSPRRLDDRYQVLELLGEGGMGEVYSARDRLTGQRVALKRLRLRGPGGVIAGPTPSGGAEGPAALRFGSDSAAPLLTLAREFRTLASIRHPHIISVLDYGFGPGAAPFFTMELLAGARPLHAAAVGQPIRGQIHLLLQVLEALTYVHRRGLLHRDLKPANVLVVGDGAEARVKLLDFGIACGRDPARPSALAGTLAYMAPELFAGDAPSEAGDLWAVAVMAHEILLGAHPLPAPNGAELVTALRGAAPIFREDPRLDPALAAVLRRALSRSPGDRHADAAAFARDLARAAGLAPPTETAEIRESFLSAAAFVARDGELATLRGALGEARAGRGSVWLVGGESGVGKSRLLDELRTLALVSGTRVGRGQAVSVGGAAYQVWQGALRPLCLDAAIDDLDAGALRAAVPDLAALLERPVPHLLEIDPQSAQARFLAALERLLLGRQEPLVLLLEDLQWADPASLAVLRRLASTAASRPWLVIASYRDDERPELRDELPGAKRLALRRLSAEGIARLSASMLGEIGRDPAVVALLQRETEGNAFFVVEVVRALAEEAGALARVGEGRLPLEVTAGGVQAVLQRRLRRVPERARPLLMAAAVLGREIDLRVLTALPGDLSARVKADLADAAAAAVIEVVEDRFRFAHDKLRAALLEQLVGPERAAWHLRVGEAIEQAYAEDLDPRSAALAHHFEQAGERDRAARFYGKAAEQALIANDLTSAITLAPRAITPQTRGEALGQILFIQAEAHFWRGDIAEAGQLALDARESLPRGSDHWYSAVQRAAESAERLGLRERILTLADELDRAVPTDTASPFQAIAIAQVISPCSFIGAGERALALAAKLGGLAARFADDPRVTGAAASSAGLLAFMTDDLGAHRAQRALALAAFDRAGDTRASCHERCWLGVALLDLGLYAEAREHLVIALDEASRIDLRFVIGAAKFSLCTVLAELGALDEARRVAAEAIAEFQAQGDSRRTTSSRAAFAAILRMDGDLDQAEIEARSSVDTPCAPLWRPLFLATLADVLLARGHAAEALLHARTAQALAAAQRHGHGEAKARLVHAESLAATGDRVGAQDAIAAAVARLVERARAIADVDARRSFLTRVGENARTLKLAEDWRDPGAQR
ncbi:MAG: AAA family ATPase [Byssovorax sp.]